MGPEGLLERPVIALVARGGFPGLLGLGQLPLERLLLALPLPPGGRVLAVELPPLRPRDVGPGVLTRGFGSAACSLQSEGPRVAGGAEEPEIPLHRGRNGRGAIPACQCGRREKPAQRLPEWTSWDLQPTG